MAKTGTPFEKAASAYRRPCLRTDLKLVYENPETGKGQVRIVDPKSGRQFTFNEKEHALCRQADGTRDLEAIHGGLIGQEATTTPAEIVDFFRRLHVLGLLEPEGTEAPHAATSAAAGRAAGLRSRQMGQRQSGGQTFGQIRGQTRGQTRDAAGFAPSPGRSAAGATAARRPRGGTTEAAERVRARAAETRAKADRETGDKATSTAASKADKKTGKQTGSEARSGRDADTARPAAPDTASSRDTSSPVASPGATPQTPSRDPADPGGALGPGATPTPATPASDTRPSPDTPRLSDAPASGAPSRSTETPPASGSPGVAGVAPPGDTPRPETSTPKTSASGTPPEASVPAQAGTPGRIGRAAGRRGAGQSGPRRRNGPGESQASLTAAAARVRERGRKPAQDETSAQDDSAPVTDDIATQSPQIPAPQSPISSDPTPPDPTPPDPTPPDPAPSDPAPDTGRATGRDRARPSARRGLGAVLQLTDRRKTHEASPEAEPEPGTTTPRSSRDGTGRTGGHATVTPRPATRDPADTTPTGAASGDSDVDEAPPDAPERAKAAESRPDVPAFSFFDDSIDEADGGMPSPPDGGMGGGMMGGGMRGMMGGGAGGGMGGMRGMMGGGAGGGMGGMRGMMGGGAGGGMGGGMMGGAGGGMMGGGAGMMGGMRGGMGGMMGGGPQGAAAGGSGGPKMPGQLKLFNPQGVLRLLYVLFYPLKYVLWALLPLVVIAGLSMFNNFEELIGDLVGIVSDIGSVTQLAIGLFVVNLASRIAQGVAIVAHGGKVPGLGIALILGVLPRFYVDKRHISELDRTGQLWGHGAPLLARLMTFAGGVLIWATTRETGTFLPQVALIAAQFGLLMFVVTSWPLMLSDGMRWLSTYLNEPKLVPKAVMAFKHVFLRAPLPPMISKRDLPGLIFYAVGTILSILLVLSVMGLGALIFLESTLDGLGVLIFLGLVAGFTVWVLALWASVTAQGKNRGGFNKEAFRQFTQGDRPTADAMPDLDGMDEEALPGKAKVVWGVILVVLLVLAFQPYKYDAGGQVEILPVSRAQAIARTDGEIIEVLVAEGDQVTRGQVLAQLSSWDQERQLAVTRNDLVSAEANLSRLEDGASPEEIEVARQQVISAETRLEYSQSEYERTRELAATGTVSQSALEKAQSTLASDRAALDVAQANLDLVLAEATANDIAIARSEVDKLRGELQFHQDELERTRVVAPMAGRVVTANLQLLTGKYLRAGDPLLEIENAEKVTAEIAVPESDIALIEPGDTVRLRVTGHANTEIVGAVRTIAPAAEDEGYGSVVRVAATFDNERDFLRSGMTGYAKIDGAEMRAWEAYLRSIRRFFQIEVWSWIP